MLTFSDLTQVGVLGRKHGTRGEVRVMLSQNIIDAEDDIPDCLFIEIDGLPVPYFVSEWKERGIDALVIKFDDIDSDREVSSLTGCKVYAQTSDLEAAGIVDSTQKLRGYKLINEHREPIGVVDYIDDLGTHQLIYITTAQQREVIVPFHEDLILDLDEEKHMLQMTIPEGLLTLND